MKAMILAAGFGTRLHPLTENKPKALVPVANRPVIARTISYLKSHGFDQIVVNAHHHQRQIVEYLGDGKPFGVDVEVRVEPDILGTGGGIKNTADFWDQAPFIVINSDILCDIDLGKAYAFHREGDSLATLLLHDCPPFNQIEVKGDRLTGIGRSNHTGRWAFTGIHIIEPELLSHLPAVGFSNIIDCYRTLIHSGRLIRAFFSQNHYWRDIGSPESYRIANREFLDAPFLTGPGSHIDPSVQLEDWAVIGERAEIHENVVIRGSILWEGVSIERGLKLVNSIVTAGNRVMSDLIDALY